MPNPKLLLCDSDVLVQLFLVDELRPLKELKNSFGIQATITLEVDIELRWTPRHRARFVAQIEKALKHGILAKLDQALFQSQLSASLPGTSWASFQSLGGQYNGYVQRGEAYTLAAALTLGMPAASNDFRAIQTIEGHMLGLPSPVLRCFDIILFAYKCGVLNLKECEKIRSDLLRRHEGVPTAFMKASFEDGLGRFRCRLKEATATTSGVSSTTGYADPLYISRI